MKYFLGFLKGLAAVIAVLMVVLLLAPKVERPNLNKPLPELTSDLIQIERKIRETEDLVPNIKPDNEARIIWADSIPRKTPYSIVYLHGWSASQEEGDPIHLEIAKRFGCNLYLPRLAGHGLLEKEPMLELTAEELLDSAREAVAVGKQLGDKLILMGTSTGGTLALHFASELSDEIAALLLYSPNVEIFDPNAKFISGPWGLQFLKAIKGSDYHEFDTDIELKNQYWTTKYRLEALTQLQSLMDATMTEETFASIKQPVFLGYYYKDQVHQDSVVSVPAMLEMYDLLGTEPEKKVKVAFPEVGDHVMTSHVSSKDLESVKEETFRYIETYLNLKPVTRNAKK